MTQALMAGNIPYEEIVERAKAPLLQIDAQIQTNVTAQDEILTQIQVEFVEVAFILLCVFLLNPNPAVSPIPVH